MKGRVAGRRRGLDQGAVAGRERGGDLYGEAALGAGVAQHGAARGERIDVALADRAGQLDRGADTGAGEHMFHLTRLHGIADDVQPLPHRCRNFHARQRRLVGARRKQAAQIERAAPAFGPVPERHAAAEGLDADHGTDDVAVHIEVARLHPSR